MLNDSWYVSFNNLRLRANMETKSLPRNLVTFPDDNRPYVPLSPQVLDQLASRWWSLIFEKHGSGNHKRDCARASRLASSFAANFEIQAWRSPCRKKDISKACFFRRIALELMPDTNSEVLAGLKAKYAATLLVKRSHSPDASLGAPLIQTIREITSLYPKRRITLFIVASMLLWLIYDYSLMDIWPSDLQTAVTFYEEATADATQDLEGKCSVCNLPQLYSLDSCNGNQTNDSTAQEVEGTLELQNQTLPKCVPLAPLQRARMQGRIQNLKSFIPVEHESFEETRDRLRACEDFISGQQVFKMNLEFYIPLFTFLFKEALEVNIIAALGSAEAVESTRELSFRVFTAVNYLNVAYQNRSRTELDKAACYIQALSTTHIGLQNDVLRARLPYVTFGLAVNQFEIGLIRHDPDLLYLGCKTMAAIKGPISKASELPRNCILGPIIKMSRWSHRITAQKGYRDRSTAFLAAQLAAHISPHIIGNPFDPNGYLILCEIGQISAAMITRRMPQSLLLDPMLYWRRCWRDSGITSDFA